MKSNLQRDGGQEGGGVQLAERGKGNAMIAKSDPKRRADDGRGPDHAGAQRGAGGTRAGHDSKEAAAPQPTKRILWVKKNQIDPTAVLSYGLGVSIVHFAMAITTT